MLKPNYSRRQDETSLNDQLSGTRQAFADFAYIVAHDLNAPLRNIVNFVQLLEEKYRFSLDEKALHYLDLIGDNGRKAQQRVASLLQYSRLNTAPLKPVPVDCNAIVSRSLESLKDDIGQRQAEIHVNPLPQLVADEDRLLLLFQCLLGNALKFSHASPVIHIQARRGHQAWVISVQDNGPGIDPKDHESIFGVFHKLQADIETPGTGMGLALVRKIVELHGGIVWLESRPGNGAEFYFSLPDQATQETPSA